MPRDINGNYTLPSGNPVIAHETIESDWANTTMPDVGAALSDSLSRSGSGGMLVPFRFIDGSISAPGLTFNNEPTSGIYRAGLNDIRVSIGTQDVLKFALGGIVIPAGKTLTGAITGGSITGGSITGGSINNTPIGDVTPSTGAFTNVSATGQVVTPLLGTLTVADLVFMIQGGSQWKVDGTSAGFVPIADNTRDIGDAAHRVRTGYFGTSVVTPTVDGGGGNLELRAGALARWMLVAADGSLQPWASDNGQNFGAPGGRIKTGYFGTSVVTPMVTTGSALILQNTADQQMTFQVNNATKWAIANSGGNYALIPGVDNALDLGVAGLRVRTGYFGTSVVSPSAFFGTTLGTSGSAIDIGKDSTFNTETGAIYIRSGAGGTNTGLLMGADKANGVAWIQSTEPSTSYASKSLTLNPNGGAVRVNGISGNVLTLGASTIDTFAAPLFLQASSAGQVRIGTAAGSNSQTASFFSVRGNGNALEFGHVNAAGYGSALGCDPNSGRPGMFLCCENDGVNTYKTRGNPGTVIQSDILGGLVIGKVPLANAAAQVLVPLVTISPAGLLTAAGGIASGIGLAPAFESAELTMAPSTYQIVPHGLGRVPKLFCYVARCKVAEGGYAVGDEVAFTSMLNSDSATFTGPTVWADAINIGCAWVAQTHTIANRTNHGVIALTNANWRCVLRAW